MKDFNSLVDAILHLDFGLTAGHADTKTLYNAISKGAMVYLRENWQNKKNDKRACYLSAEFLVGRLVYSNLLNLGLLEKCNDYLKMHDLDISIFEDIEDNALGNGGLGRLAACFLDSAATHNIALDGFGLRYKYGLFKQSFSNGFQVETEDNWTSFCDPWSVRRDDESIIVHFANQSVKAVPYDMPIIGYKTNTINTLRLWQSEPLDEFNFELFNKGNYDLCVKEKNDAENITKVLYPNDDTIEGKQLRLKQQYLFSSASIQTLINRYIATNGNDFSNFNNSYAIQLNDTHPVIAIVEFVRLLVVQYSVPFEDAFTIAQNTFAYTNHTIMAEALEKWNVELFVSVVPLLYPYIVMINDRLIADLKNKNINHDYLKNYTIVENGTIHMARLAIYVAHSTNGVAKIHTEILKQTALKEWFNLYPNRFNNKTNGITQRRWLTLCNKELTQFIKERIGDGFITNLTEIKKLEEYTDERSINEFINIKRLKKEQLAKYIEQKEGIFINPNFIFDIQIKRLHEYKRQLMNALSILDCYFQIKKGELKDFYPTLYLFGAKAAPGYHRAKAIIKLIHEIAKLINNDNEVNQKMQVVFITNYNVSYAEKLIPAADISEQISTAGTEASGTGNMKFMLNGAVTLGTLDGANIEIVQQAGQENNYIFGCTVEDIASLTPNYNPIDIYNKNPRIKKVLNCLIDGTLSDDNTGMFKELYDSILKGASWHNADQYFILADFISYCDKRLEINNDYKDKISFAKKCFKNTANAGVFSSDRTIKEYAKDIWNLE